MNGSDDICCNCQTTNDVRSGTLVIKNTNKTIRVETQMCKECIGELDAPIYFFEVDDEERYLSIIDLSGRK